MNKRFEHKHLFRSTDRDIVFNELSHRLSGSAVYKSYVNKTRYYDTPTLSCYWAKINGEAHRFKIRIREHESGAQVLEWKIRHYDMCFKHQQILTNFNVTNTEIMDLWPHQYLQRNSDYFYPTLDGTYVRHEWTLSQGTRLTFDEHLVFKRAQSDHYLPIGKVILEFKVDIAEDYTSLRKKLSSLNLEPVTVSKYCIGVEQVGLS